MPCESWIVIVLRSFSAAVVVLERVASDPRGWVRDIDWRCGREMAEDIREDALGWYSVQREQARVACVRRVDAGRGEVLERSLPVGDKRMRVGSWGVVFWERKVVRRFVRSIVCDIMSRSGEGGGWE
jgi:hypothetical protein